MRPDDLRNHPTIASDKLNGLPVVDLDIDGGGPRTICRGCDGFASMQECQPGARHDAAHLEGRDAAEPEALLTDADEGGNHVSSGSLSQEGARLVLNLLPNGRIAGREAALRHGKRLRRRQPVLVNEISQHTTQCCRESKKRPHGNIKLRKVWNL